MFRRPSLIAFIVCLAFASITLACAASPALANDPLRSQPVDGGARLVPGAGGAHLADTGTGTAITFRPSTTLLKYGKAVVVAGNLTDGGEPLSASTVTLRETRGGVTRNGGTATTDDQGFYRTLVVPRFSASWGATAAGAASSPTVIRVMPKVTLALSHVMSGRRLTEIFRGTVRPAHAGRRMLVQRSTASGWRTVASGRLNRRSRYSIRWRLPYRTATYKLRAVLPAHGDHAAGASPTATVRVRIGKG